MNGGTNLIILSPEMGVEHQNRECLLMCATVTVAHTVSKVHIYSVYIYLLD